MWRVRDRFDRARALTSATPRRCNRSSKSEPGITLERPLQKRARPLAFCLAAAANTGSLLRLAAFQQIDLGLKPREALQMQVASKIQPFQRLTRSSNLATVGAEGGQKGVRSAIRTVQPPGNQSHTSLAIRPCNHFTRDFQEFVHLLGAVVSPPGHSDFEFGRGRPNHDKFQPKLLHLPGRCWDKRDAAPRRHHSQDEMQMIGFVGRVWHEPRLPTGFQNQVVIDRDGRL